MTGIAAHPAQDPPDVVPLDDEVGIYEWCRKFADGRIARHELLRVLAIYPYSAQHETPPWKDHVAQPDTSLVGVEEAFDDHLIDRELFEECLEAARSGFVPAQIPWEQGANDPIEFRLTGCLNARAGRAQLIAAHKVTGLAMNHNLADASVEVTYDLGDEPQLVAWARRLEGRPVTVKAYGSGSGDRLRYTPTRIVPLESRPMQVVQRASWRGRFESSDCPLTVGADEEGQTLAAHPISEPNVVRDGYAQPATEVDACHTLVTGVRRPRSTPSNPLEKLTVTGELLVDARRTVAEGRPVLYLRANRVDGVPLDDRDTGLPSHSQVDQFDAIAAEVDGWNWATLALPGWPFDEPRARFGWEGLLIHEHGGANTATVMLRCAQKVIVTHGGHGLDADAATQVVCTLWQPRHHHPLTQAALDERLANAWDMFARRADEVFGARSPVTEASQQPERLLRSTAWTCGGYHLVLTAVRTGPWPFEPGHTSGWVGARWQPTRPEPAGRAAGKAKPKKTRRLPRVARTDPRGEAFDPPADWAEIKDRVLGYLRSGRVFTSERDLDPDLRVPDQPDTMPVAFHTDGFWVWSAATIHYAELHDSPVDPALIDHVRARDYRTAPASDDAVAAALEAIRRAVKTG